MPQNRSFVATLLTTYVLLCQPAYSDLVVDTDEPYDNFARHLKEALEATDAALQLHTNDSLAIAHEWIQLKVKVSDGPIGNNSERFLGYVSGRLRLTPPKWWSDEIKMGWVYPSGHVRFLCRDIRDRWHTNKSGWQFSGFELVENREEGLGLFVGAFKVILRKRDFAEAFGDSTAWDSETDSAIAGSVNALGCAVAFGCPTDLDGPSHLSYIDEATGKRIWTRELSDLSRRGGFSGGSTGSFTEVQIVGDDIVVWNAHDYSVSVEVYGRNKGTRTTKFVSACTN